MRIARLISGHRLSAVSDTRFFAIATLLLFSLLSTGALQVMASDSTDRLAPRPFTANQIRDFCVGLTLVFRNEQAEEVSFSETTFFAATDTLGKLISRSVDSEGTVLEEAAPVELPWVALRDHASFPALRTQVVDEICTTPTGTYECWLYTVEAKDAESGLERFYFAKERPGPPVLYETEAGGSVTFRSILVDERR